MELSYTVSSIKDVIDQTEEMHIKSRTQLEAISGTLKQSTKFTDKSVANTCVDKITNAFQENIKSYTESITMHRQALLSVQAKTEKYLEKAIKSLQSAGEVKASKVRYARDMLIFTSI